MKNELLELFLNVLIIFTFGALTYALWNAALVPAVAGLSKVSFWQGVGIWLLIRVCFVVKLGDYND